MYLFFDTETNGKPINYKAPMQDLGNWPRVTQLAWQVYDADEYLASEATHLIKPDGWTIPTEKLFVDNGMSTERNMAQGVPVLDVLGDFIKDVNVCVYIVAHNFQFDYNILGAEMLRGKVRADKKLKGICTMNSTTDFCGLPGNYGKFKWPKLEELHQILFGESFDGAHDALADVRAMARCFFEAKRLGIITLPA